MTDLSKEATAVITRPINYLFIFDLHIDLNEGTFDKCWASVPQCVKVEAHESTVGSELYSLFPVYKYIN